MIIFSVPRGIKINSKNERNTIEVKFPFLKKLAILIKQVCYRHATIYLTR